MILRSFLLLVMVAIYCATLANAGGCPSNVVAPYSFMIPPDDINSPMAQFKCKDAAIDINGKYYDAISCTDGKWKGDGVDDLPLNSNKIIASCFGAFDLESNCDASEMSEGCAKVTRADDFLSCNMAGYVLMRKGYTTLHKLLQVIKGRWHAGNDIGEAKTADRPLCYSICASKFVDTKIPPGSVNAGNTRDAKYDFSAKRLMCSDPTDILISTIDGGEKLYLNGLTCDETKGWKADGNVVKDLINPVKVDDLKVEAHCFKACDAKKIVYSLRQEEDQHKYDSFLHELSCPESSVLYVNNKEMDKNVVCKNTGWYKKGDESTPIIDHKTSHKDTISVECALKCGKKFVTKSSSQITSAGDRFTCGDYALISYTFDGGSEVTTIEDLICDDKGWLEGSRGIDSFPTGLSKKITINCNPSCTIDDIKDNCGVRKNCGKPKFTDYSLTCPKSGTVLWAQGKTELTSIKCTKKKFENADTSNRIHFNRAVGSMSAEITCISKCDKKEFMDLTASTQNGAAQFAEVEDDNGKYTVECKDPLHYTTLESNGVKAFSAKEITCDPGSGWSAADHKNGAVFAHFDGKKVLAGCHSICENRVDGSKICSDYIPASNICKDVEPVLTANKELKCNNEYSLRTIDDAGTKLDHVRKTLTCTKEGFKLSDTLVLPFKGSDPSADAEKKFSIACISNCAKEFAGESGGDSTAWTLSCAHDEIIVVDLGDPIKTRVFSDMTCDAATGWKSTEGLIVDFSKQVKFTKEVRKVCDYSTTIQQLCESREDSCQKATAAQTTDNPAKKTLTCEKHHQLFLNGKSSKTEVATCDNKGWWDNDAKPLVDFEDVTLDISKEKFVSVTCKHKCHVDFIDLETNSCTADTTCTEAKYEDRKLSCTHDTEILVIDHSTGTKEAFEAICDDDGWHTTKEDGSKDQLFKMDQIDYKVNVRCENMCALKDPDDPAKKEMRVYDSEKKTLTCSDLNEMLVLDGSGVYSDMLCTRAGWKKITTGIIQDNAKFTPATTKVLSRARDFQCVMSDCMRPMHCQPGQPDAKKCENPDFKTRKYFMSCSSPMKIKRTDEANTYYAESHCENGVWKEGNRGDNGIWKYTGSRNTEQVEDVDKAKPVAQRPPFSVICYAEGCAKCKRDDTRFVMAYKSPDEELKWAEGSFTHCAGYKCPNFHYKISDGNYFKYFKNEGSHKYVTCEKETEEAADDKFLYDGRNIIGLVGCVKQIPCNEHSLLNTNCTDILARNVACDSEKIKKIHAEASILKNGKVDPVKCDTNESIYYMTAPDKWSKVESLKCNAYGEWEATYPSNPMPEVLLSTRNEKKAPRVVCASSDPSKRIPPPPETPLNEKDHICNDQFCPNIADQKCDGCKSLSSTALRKPDNGKCIYTTSPGRFQVNDNEETTDTLICEKENGEFVWKTKEGIVVKTAAIVEKITDGIDWMLFGGLAVLALVVLGVIVAGFFIWRHRKKKELARLETLKSKGLEQKLDSVLEAVSVEDPKTVML